MYEDIKTLEDLENHPDFKDFFVDCENETMTATLTKEQIEFAREFLHSIKKAKD